MIPKTIRHFSFQKAHIRENSCDLLRWHNFVRNEEFRMIMSVLGDIKFRNALELGAGDGGQSRIIAQYCHKLTCTELDELGNIIIGRFSGQEIPHVTYEFCDATDLSRFADKSFDFIFSSNMLEHIPRWDLCLEECTRVLEDDGVMIHVMPSRTWKVWNAVVSVIFKRRPPSIHGTSTSHFREYIDFGERNWARKIEDTGLMIDIMLRLPFYHGNGPIVIPLIILGNQLGWKSSTAYVLRKAP